TEQAVGKTRHKTDHCTDQKVGLFPAVCPSAGSGNRTFPPVPVLLFLLIHMSLMSLHTIHYSGIPSCPVVQYQYCFTRYGDLSPGPPRSADIRRICSCLYCSDLHRDYSLNAQGFRSFYDPASEL